MAEGTAVGLRTDVADTVYDPDGVTQWWPVSAGDADGWVAGFYLDIEGFSAAPTRCVRTPIHRAAPAASGSLGGEGATASEEQFLATWDLANAAALVAEPEGVNLRQDPGSSSPAVKTLSFQTVVELRVDEVDTVYTEGSRWWPVQIDGLVGWVAGQYLAPTESTWAEPEVDADDGGVRRRLSKVADWFEAGSYVLADTDDGSGLNIRADGAPDAERIGIVPEDDVVQVMDGPYNDPIGNPWYLITDGEVTGFVSGWYLSRADQPGEDLAQHRHPLEGDRSPAWPRARSTTRSQSWVFTQSFGCSPYWFEPWDSGGRLQLPQRRRPRRGRLHAAPGGRRRHRRVRRLV